MVIKAKIIEKSKPGHSEEKYYCVVNNVIKIVLNKFLRCPYAENREIR
ncbi:MAG: hypothetical protein BWY27_00393 [Bacteroidetes bacterium ADurb.Bin234]|jgi:hypothetical protein|nr:MAG: hypothetical protein BWY27_00393 [Bacteroidetes bacterium ADurb.Bin234]